ncbi:hypothetical protein [Polaribacter marinivivus]|uniref:Uncharacterized protein n=1 Tax=Polaribacter marinivivus TaxID=1524260 RepID=A0ABV8R7D1_9FLAO
MTKKLIIILILLISNLINAQIKQNGNTLEIWTLFSPGNFVNQNAEQIVEKKWPFKIKGIAGDTFPENLIDSLETHNNRIWNYLDANGYSNSKKKFETDLQTEIKRIKKAVDISNSDKRVIAILDKLRKKGLQNYTELNKLCDVKYEFLLYSFNMNVLDKEQTFELKYIADLEKEKIKIID